MMRRIYIWLFVMIAMILSSCHTEYCRENMYIQADVRLYNYFNHTQAVSLSDVAVFTLDENGNEIAQLPIDSSTSRLPLILSPESDTSRFLIKSNYLNNEKLVIVHTNTPEFVSAECGCRVKSYIDTVYIDNIAFTDSIVIFNHTVNEVYDNENIQIFLHINE